VFSILCLKKSTTNFSASTISFITEVNKLGCVIFLVPNMTSSSEWVVVDEVQNGEELTL